MAATSAVNDSRIGQGAPSLKNIPSSRITQLFQKVDWVLVLGVTVAASYLFYHLYKVAQLISHSALGLSESFRTVKCRTLLDEAHGKGLSDAKPLLQECEILIATMTDTDYSFDKEPVVLGLALAYVESNPDRACQIAQQLSAGYRLSKVAEAIQKQHPTFDKAKLSCLWQSAFEDCVEMDQKPEPLMKTSLRQWLQFAEVFHSLGNAEFKNKSYQQALALARQAENDLDRITAWRLIAKCCQKTQDSSWINVCITETRGLIDAKLANSISAHLELAYMFFYARKYEEMQKELVKVEELFNQDIATVKAAQLVSLVPFAKAIEKSDEVPPQLKNFNARSFIDRAYTDFLNFKGDIGPEESALFLLKIVDAYQSIKDATKAKEVLDAVVLFINSLENSPEKARFFLTLAYDYKTCKDEASAKKMSSLALGVIQILPEDTDEQMQFKRDLLRELLQIGHPDEAVAALQILESLYGKIPNTKFVEMKIERGMEILRAYNERNRTAESWKFMKKFLEDFEKSNDRTFSKINRLSFEFISPFKPEDYFKNPTNVEQARTLLEAAEKQLHPLSSSERDIATPQLAHAYLQLDRSKALEFLKGAENRQAVRHFAKATVSALALGAIYYFRDSLIGPSLGVLMITSI